MATMERLGEKTGLGDATIRSDTELPSDYEGFTKYWLDK
jgi:hypothetical protein